MRTAAALFAVLLAVPSAPARPGGEVYEPKGAGYRVKFPGRPTEATEKPTTDAGQVVVRMASYATSKGESFLTASNDLPGGKAADAVKKDLLDKVVTGAAGTDGKVTESKDEEFGPDKLPARRFTIEKGKQQIRGLAVVTDTRLYQVMVYGPKDFVTGKEAKAFFNSFELTK